MFEIFSDGSSSGGSGKPGGYGWVLCRDEQIVTAGFGGAEIGTNNTMEMTGAIEGLKALKASGLWTGEPVFIVSDSEYVLGIASGRMFPSKNLELAAEIRALFLEFRAKTRWVRGHQLKKRDAWQEQSRDVLLNTRCDQLAKLGRKTYQAKAGG